MAFFGDAMMTTCLLLLDLQNDIVDADGKLGASGLAEVVRQRGVLANARRALDAARSRGQMVVHVRVGFRPDYADSLSVAPRVQKLKAAGAAVIGTWGCEFAQSVAPLPGEVIITKQCVNPFFNTNLLTLLLRRGIAQVVLGGVATNLVVESTARAADDAGFGVTVLEDCCAAPNPEWHRFSVTAMLPLFGSVSDSTTFAAS